MAEQREVENKAIHQACTTIEEYGVVDERFPKLHARFDIGFDVGRSGLDDSEYGRADSALMTSSDRLSLPCPLPQEVLLRFKRLQCSTLQGVFPQINRAWFTIDSDFFIWDLDDGSDFCVYDGLQEVIVAVALAAPRPDVFRDEITHVLVLTTPMNIILIGLEFDPHTHDSVLLSNYRGRNLNFDAESMRIIPSDNVILNTIASSDDGRIFLGGQDGCIYELIYEKNGGWFRSKCRKINHTKSVLSYFVPSLIKTFIGGSEEIQSLTYDSTRHMLYAKTPASIQPYLLSNAGGFIRGVPVTLDYPKERYGSIISIAPVASYESDKLAFMAVTQRGARLYFGNLRGVAWLQDEEAPRLSLLSIRVIKESLTPPSNVTQAFASNGVLLFASGAGQDKESVWGVTSSDISNAVPLPSSLVNTRIGNFHTVARLAEVVAIDSIQGPVWQIVEVPAEAKVARSHNPLAQQELLPRRSFIIMSASGTSRYSTYRLVDVLRKLLERSNEQLLAEFFHMVIKDPHNIDTDAIRAQRREAFATCLIIICSREDQDLKLRERAKEAFRRFGGEPEILNSDIVSAGGNNFGAAAIGPRILYSSKHDGVYMYVSRLLRPLWSKHAIVRDTLIPSVLTSSMKPEDIIDLIHHLKILQSYLQSSGLVADSAFGAREQWEKQHIHRRVGLVKPRAARMTVVDAAKLYGDDHSSTMWQQYLLMDRQHAVALENESLASLNLLIVKFLEILCLFDLLMTNDISTTLGELPEPSRVQCTKETFGTLASTEDGQRLCKNAISKFLKRVSGTPLYKVQSDRLFSACPHLHNQHDVVYADAIENLLMAQATRDQSFLKPAMVAFKRYFNEAEPFPFVELTKACEGLISADFYTELVDIVIYCSSLTKWASALKFYRDYFPEADEIGSKAYSSVTRCWEPVLTRLDSLLQEPGVYDHVLHVLPDYLSGAAALPSDIDALKHMVTVIQKILVSDFELAHVVLFDWSRDHQLTNLILKSNSPFLETYLSHIVEANSRASDISSQIKSMELLAQYYSQNGQFIQAAKIYHQLSDAELVGITKQDVEHAIRSKVDGTDDGTSVLPLQTRIGYLTKARVCDDAAYARPAAVAGHISFLQELRSKRDFAQLQQRIFNELQSLCRACPLTGADRYGKNRSNYLRALIDLQLELKNLQQLHDDFATKFHVPICALELVYLARTMTSVDLEDWWLDVIEHLFGEYADHDIALRHLSDVIRPYKAANASIPIGFIIQQLDKDVNVQDCDQAFSTGKALLQAGFSHAEIFQAYHAILGQIPQIRKEKSVFLHATARVLLSWLETDEAKDVIEVGRIVSAYITELNTRTDGFEKHISKEMKAIQDRLVVAPRVPNKRW